MTGEDAPAGARVPRQARSRETLARLLAATEALLVEAGADGITMSGVAARAEVSVGTVYRRFENRDVLLRAVKDRMLTRLGDRLTDRLREPPTDLRAAITAYTAAVVDWMVESGRLLPEVFGTRLDSPPGVRAEGLAALRRLLAEAAAPHRDEIRRDDADAVLAFVGRTVTAAAMHRALSVGAAPDGLTWASWQAETVDMAMAYVRAGRSGAGAAGQPAT